MPATSWVSGSILYNHNTKKHSQELEKQTRRRDVCHVLTQAKGPVVPPWHSLVFLIPSLRSMMEIALD